MGRVCMYDAYQSKQLLAHREPNTSNTIGMLGNKRCLTPIAGEVLALVPQVETRPEVFIRDLDANGMSGSTQLSKIPS